MIDSTAAEHGDWRKITSYALAALVCGFFWELWNYYSLVRWIYDVPYVNALHIFEMPLLGYAGYIPFGILCGLLIEAVNSSAANAHAVFTKTR